MTRLHFIGGEKGGVGKSVLARVLSQYCIDRQLRFKAYDSDQSHTSLLRFYQEFAVRVDPGSFDSLDGVFEALVAVPPVDEVVVDLAAQTLMPLSRWIDESGMFEALHESGGETWFWHVTDGGRDSVDLLQQLVDRFGVSTRIVVVLNHGRGGSFDLFTTAMRKRVAELGGSVIEMPRLHDSTMRKIDAGSNSFWAAAHAESGAGLNILERQRVKVWTRRLYTQLDALLARPHSSVAAETPLAESDPVLD